MLAGDSSYKRGDLHLSGGGGRQRSLAESQKKIVRRALNTKGETPGIFLKDLRDLRTPQRG